MIDSHDIDCAVFCFFLRALLVFSGCCFVVLLFCCFVVLLFCCFVVLLLFCFVVLFPLLNLLNLLFFAFSITADKLNVCKK